MTKQGNYSQLVWPLSIATCHMSFGSGVQVFAKFIVCHMQLPCQQWLLLTGGPNLWVEHRLSLSVKWAHPKFWPLLFIFVLVQRQFSSFTPKPVPEEIRNCGAITRSKARFTLDQIKVGKSAYGVDTGSRKTRKTESELDWETNCPVGVHWL